MKNVGGKKRPHLLVLECTWEDELGDRTSVRPFFEGWGDALGIRVAWRPYGTREGLAHWLSEFFSARTNPSICYIAGHGEGRNLLDVRGRGIQVVSALRAACPNKRGPAKNKTTGKGVLLGSCEVGSAEIRKEILQNTKSSLAWVAGYERDVPWLESTLCDQLFLTYMLYGRHTRVGGVAGEFVPDGEDDFKSRKTSKAEVAANWVRADFLPAGACEFGATDRTS